MARVVLEQVAKRYGDVVALHPLDLEAVDGELLVLVGPSGSGKTTTLRVIAGLEDADGGRVAIGARDVTALPPGERDAAMVFQSYALFPHLSVFENIAFGLRARKQPRESIERDVREAAATLSIEHLLDRKPRQLSGGERQRVALGRALVRHPAVFLMDEPLSNLDARLRVQTRAEIQRLQSKLGVTTLYVTHDQSEALALGHRIAVLDGGVLQQLGTPAQVYDEPANAFVAGFIGSPPMNLIAFERQEGMLAWDGGRWPHATSAPRGLLGVRPEHVRVAGSAGAGVQPVDTIAATVEALESTGDASILVADAGGATIAARVERAFSARPGDAVRLWFDADRVHVFGEDGRPAR